MEPPLHPITWLEGDSTPLASPPSDPLVSAGKNILERPRLGLKGAWEIISGVVWTGRSPSTSEVLFFASAIGWPIHLEALVPETYYQWVAAGSPCVWYAYLCEDPDWKRIWEAWLESGTREKFEAWAQGQGIPLQGPGVGEIFVEWVSQGSPAEGELQMTRTWLETTSGGGVLGLAADPSAQVPVSVDSILPSAGTPRVQGDEGAVETPPPDAVARVRAEVLEEVERHLRIAGGTAVRQATDVLRYMRGGPHSQ